MDTSDKGKNPTNDDEDLSDEGNRGHGLSCVWKIYIISLPNTEKSISNELLKIKRFIKSCQVPNLEQTDSKIKY